MALVSVPAVFLCVECVLALAPFKRGYKAQLGRPAAAVLVPAHNEEAVISQTLEAIRAQLLVGDRLVVVADNCTDGTAAVAASAGAEVLERHDVMHRGKGFALAHGMAALAEKSPNIVVLMDADCLPMPGAIPSLIVHAASAHKPAQALYLLESPADPRPRNRVSAFAFLVKNHVRALGAQRLGLPCLLRGTGMAFPWEVIRTAPLATGNIVEDLQLGIDLTLAGHAPVFCPEALVTGCLPSNAAATKKQRTRWEHGHLHTIRKTVLPTMAKALLHFRPDLLLLALDIAVPPLSLLVLIWTMLGVASCLVWRFTGAALPIDIWACGAVMLLTTLLAVWMRFGRKIIGLATLAAIPLYVLAKIPMYVGYVLSREREWVRTERDAFVPGNPAK